MTIRTESWKKPATPWAQAAAAMFGMVVTRMGHVLQGFRNRNDAAMLASLDDRMLADIGLTRGDIRDAFSEPVWRDPTAILLNRATERRLYRRKTLLRFAPRAVEAPSLVPAAGERAAQSCC